MTKQISVASDFRAERNTGNETLRGAMTSRQSARGFLLGFVACLIVAGTVLYEVATRFA